MVWLGGILALVVIAFAFLAVRGRRYRDGGNGAGASYTDAGHGGNGSDGGNGGNGGD